VTFFLTEEWLANLRSVKPDSYKVYLRIRHVMYSGVEVVGRSVYLELVQRNVGVVKADVRNTLIIRRYPVSHARVQYLFCLHVKSLCGINTAAKRILEAWAVLAVSRGHRLDTEALFSGVLFAVSITAQ